MFRAFQTFKVLLPNVLEIRLLFIQIEETVPQKNSILSYPSRGREVESTGADGLGTDKSLWRFGIDPL
jgi:hypothetical protein